MEYVNPIKDIELIFQLKQTLKTHSSRNFLLFVIGINTGLRISELLVIRVKDVLTDGGEPLDFIQCDREDIALNRQVQSTLKWYFTKHTTLDPQAYLFQSSRGTTPISRQQAYRVMNNAAEKIGMTEKIGPHTLRKTFGYHAYKKGIAVSLIQKRFCHHSPGETLRYIGIDKNKLKPRLDVNL
ncbi:site-specific integrase [Salibacterium salarium]|uniref:Site-specific integrase n=1 Tax=Salibacterium salarium TaxID=284579 RepID=A0A3R9WWC6_9BACI|nr:tyrosine-type recombinase/integrase [Salibacterium salarium]RSL34932.1 site-specific integrase [Salibacterium salarium]